MKLQSLRLGLSNIARTTNTKTLPVIRATKNYDRDNEGNVTENVKEYVVECGTRMYDTIKIKFPPSLKAEIEKLEQMLENNMLVEIGFTNLKLTPYALESKNGSLISGVTGRASGFTIVSSESDDLDDIVIED